MVISTIQYYKHFNLYDKFYFSQLIQESGTLAKKARAKRSELSLIRADKFAILSFMTLDLDLVMMSDKEEML